MAYKTVRTCLKKENYFLLFSQIKKHDFLRFFWGGGCCMRLLDRTLIRMRQHLSEKNAGFFLRQDAPKIGWRPGSVFDPLSELTWTP